MKTKHFYSFLVETTSITLELSDLDLSPKERIHLLSLVDANIHSSVIKIVLDNLSSDEKKIFLKNLSTVNHETIWFHLKNNIKDAEALVKNSIDKTIKELMEDIKKSKNHKGKK